MVKHKYKNIYLTITFVIFTLFISTVMYSNPVYTIDDLSERTVIENFRICSDGWDSSGKYITEDLNSDILRDYHQEKLYKNTENRGIDFFVYKDTQKRLYTLRCDFYVVEDLKEKDIALYTANVDYPCKIYINGLLIEKLGSYKENKNYTTDEAQNIYLSKDMLNYGTNINKLAIELFSDYQDRPFDKVIISSQRNIINDAFWKNFFNIHGIQAVALTAFIIFIYFMLLFVSGRLKKSTNFYFSMICLFFALSYANVVFDYEANNELLIEKITRTSFIITTYFSLFFVMDFLKLFSKKLKLIIKLSMYALMLAGIILIFIQTEKNKVLDIYGYFQFYTLIPCLLADVGLTIYSIVKVGFKLDRVLLLTAFLVIIATSLHDIFILSGLYPYAWLLPYGFWFFAITIFILMARDQSKLNSEIINVKNTLDRLTINIHNSLKNKLDSAKNLIDVYKIDKVYDKELNNIEKLITHCSKECKNLLFIIKNNKCDVETLCKEIKLRTELAIMYGDIEFELKTHYSKKNEYINPEIVQSLLDIYTELLNNAIRHSRASMVSIVFEYDNKNIKLSIQDNGTGFDWDSAKKIEHVYGIEIIENLADNIGAELIVNSKRGEGSYIEINVENTK